MSERRILMRSDPNYRRELAEVLQIVATAELLRPSRRLWLAATDVANAPILDNQAGGFNSVEPSWGERFIGVFELLDRNMALGGEVVVVTSAESAARLRLSIAANQRLTVRTPANLSVYGVAGDGFFLGGKLAWSAAGVSVVEEGVFLETGEAAAARAAALFAQAYGDIS